MWQFQCVLITYLLPALRTRPLWVSSLYHYFWWLGKFTPMSYNKLDPVWWDPPTCSPPHGSTCSIVMSLVLLNTRLYMRYLPCMSGFLEWISDITKQIMSQTSPSSLSVNWVRGLPLWQECKWSPKPISRRIGQLVQNKKNVCIQKDNATPHPRPGMETSINDTMLAEMHHSWMLIMFASQPPNSPECKH